MAQSLPVEAHSTTPLWRESAVLRVVGLLLLLVATFSSYSGALDAGFTNWDDPAYVTQNELIKEPDWKAMWGEFYWASYTPLTLTSYALEWMFAPDDPRVFHATSLALHLGVTALVFFFFLGLRLGSLAAILGAAVFALHPVHVEAVVWVSGRKDLLCSFFYLLSLCSYLRYVQKPLPTRCWKSLVFLGLTVLAAALALLSKASAVTLPVMLVLLDRIAGRRWFAPKVLAEKLPVFIFAAVAAGLMIKAQGAAHTFENAKAANPYGLSEQIVLSGLALFHYLRTLLWPGALSSFYPFPKGPFGAADYVFVLLVPLGLYLLAWTWKRDRLLCFGLAFLGLGLAPVLQILHYANFFVADRYLYLPSIGFCVIVARVFERLPAWLGAKSSTPGTKNDHGQDATRSAREAPAQEPAAQESPAQDGAGSGMGRMQMAFAATLALYCALLGIRSAQRVPVWNDSLSLWDDVIAQYPGVYQAFDHRGSAKAEAGDIKGAIADHTRAIELEPRHIGAYFNRGNAYAKQGEWLKAARDYQVTATLQPSNEAAKRNLALVMQLAKRDPRARKAAQAGGEGSPELLAALKPLVEGQPKQALDNLNRFIATHPKDSKAYNYRALCHIALGDHNAALSDTEQALALSPGNVEAYVTQGAAHYNLGQLDKAIADFDNVLEKQPSHPKALLNRGFSHLKRGNKDKGCQDLKKASALGSQEAVLTAARYCGG